MLTSKQPRQRYGCECRVCTKALKYTICLISWWLTLVCLT